MVKVLKICCGTWDAASRDRRELSAYRELGAEIFVMAKGNKNDKGRQELVDGFTVFKFSTVFLSSFFPRKLNSLVALFKWVCYVKAFQADVLSCHDIYALLIGWLSTLFVRRRNRPKLIYDSHEFEIGRNTSRSKLETRCIIMLEKFLINRSAFTIVVCDSIADEMQKVHKLRFRPLVVRSTPECWNVSSATCVEKRHEIQSLFPVCPEFIMMFHGNLGRGNGLEYLLYVLEKEPSISLVLMGEQTDAEEILLLKSLAERLCVRDRILYLPPVPQKEIWKYAGAVDLEMMLIQPIVRSYYFALPNKFFEAVQSLTPIIASDLPEMKSLIDKYQIGLTCDINDIDSIIKAVERMRTDKDFYSTCKKNMELAKNELCWENEKNILKEAFNNLKI